MRGVRVFALAVCCTAWAVSAFAQQSIDSATISGRVTDPSGAVVPGAMVDARHVETNVATEAVTDQQGRFRLRYLRSGPYALTVRRQGFRDVARSLTLTAGAAFDLPISLTVAALDASVSVTAALPVLEAARSQIAGTIPQAEVRALPLNGRDFLELALLVPGVSAANVASTQLFPETSPVPGVSLSIGSQRNLSNNFIVDGLSANDDAAALSGMTYGVDAVEQVQVVTSGAQAELGRALGGYISIVTRSGTNDRRGDVYGFVRDDRFNARNPLLPAGVENLPMDQQQYGASIGGPIVENRTFYFANVEQRRLDQSGLVTILPGNVSAINGGLAEVGYQGPLVSSGIYPNPVDTTNLLGKVDHQVSDRDRLSVRYSLYTVSSVNSRGAGALNAPSASAGLKNGDHTVAIGNMLVLSPRTVLESRGQFAFGDLKAPPTDAIGPAVSISGVASFGTSSGSPTRRVNKMYQAMNSLSHQAGAHAMRAGIDVLYNDDRITYPRSIRGTYTFSSLANFLAGAYNNAGFSQTFGATEVAQTNPNVGVFAQDEWKVGGRVTLNLGVRYDLQYLETIKTDTNNVSPRVGVAWSPAASLRTVVRASAGVFYDRVPLRPLANALLSAGNTTDLSKLRQIGVSLSPGQAGAPVFPNILSSVVPSVTLVNLTTMDRNLQNAASRQMSTEIERQIGDRVTVSAGYSYLRGRDLLMSISQNAPACVATGTNNGCRPNPSYANNSQYSSVGESVYHALQVSLLHRPSRWGQVRVSYTLSKSENNVGEFFFSSPIDPTDLSRDWGRSDDDQRHRLAVNGSISAPFGVNVAGSMQAYSALPLNITSGVTTVQGTTGRPVVDGAFIARNAGTGGDFFTINARVSRTFRLAGRVNVEALVEGFNLTNRRNVVTRNTNFGTGAYPTNPLPAFGQVTAVGEMRSAQLGLRVGF